VIADSIVKPASSSREDAEIQKQRSDAAKQRHFAEQQRRLQDYGSLGGRKVDADTLIESILGKSESKRPVSTSVTSSTLSATVVTSPSMIGM